MTPAAPVVVLHAVGDPAGGRPWHDALDAAGWAGPILAPDLPGHAGAPPPTGGNHELADPVLFVVPLLDQLGPDRPVVVGVGANGWPAQLLALGGRTRGLVLVDGLGAPWLSPVEAVHAGVAELRALRDDRAAMAEPAAGAAVDPRLRHGPRPHGSRALAQRAAAATPVPTLVVESPASAADADDRADLVPRVAGGATLVEVPDAGPRTVADAIVRWATRQRPPSRD